MSSFFWGTFLCFTFLHILGRNGVISQTIIRSNAGETAYLRCPFQTTPQELARVTWTKDGRDKIVNVTGCTGNAVTSCSISRSIPEKYAVDSAGRISSGFTLIISGVTLADDGIYDCKVVRRGGLDDITFRLAVTYVPTEIAVIDVEKDVEVSNRSTLYAVVNRPYKLNCTIPSPCNPPANITWSAPDLNAQISNQANHISASDSPLVTSSRTMTLTALSVESMKMVRCTAMHYGLSAPLSISLTFDVGNLPESPSNSANWISSVTVSSFIVTWVQGASGGKPQTFTVTYCEVFRPDECSEISGIISTRVRIGNLRPFTLYDITVKSHTVFGFSELNESVQKSTRPLSPSELGVEGVYSSQRGGSVDVQANSNSTTLPNGLCFHLIDQQLLNQADAAAQDCVSVGEYLIVPSGRSWKNMALVSYGNGVSSESSKITGSETVIGLPIIIGASVGGAVLLIMIIMAIYCMRKGRSSMEVRANRQLPPQPQQTRQLPGHDQMDSVPGYEPPSYYGIKYQEVGDQSDRVSPVGDLYATHHSYQDAQHPPEGPSEIPLEARGNGLYYSRNIAMGNKKEVDERYGYMEPSRTGATN
nr:uncharacterized protein LOC129266118 [Lytechinus pictus]